MENQLVVTAIREVVAVMEGRDSVPVQELYGAVLIALPASEARIDGDERPAVEDRLGSTLMAWLDTRGLGWHEQIQASDLDDLASHWTHSFY